MEVFGDAVERLRGLSAFFRFAFFVRTAEAGSFSEAARRLGRGLLGHGAGGSTAVADLCVEL